MNYQPFSQGSHLFHTSMPFHMLNSPPGLLFPPLFSWQSPLRPFNIQLKFHLFCEGFSDVLRTTNQFFFSKTIPLYTIYHTRLHYIDYTWVSIPSLSSLKAGTLSFHLQNSALGLDTWLSKEMKHVVLLLCDFLLHIRGSELDSWEGINKKEKTECFRMFPKYLLTPLAISQEGTFFPQINPQAL